MPFSDFARHRLAGVGLLSTGVFCPCHVLVGLAGFVTGGSLVLAPAAQDGLHAVYVPFAVLFGALLLRRRQPRPLGEPNITETK